MRRRRALHPPSTLLARINLVHAASATVIALTAITALVVFVIRPIEDRSAADIAGLVVLSAQTWVELPPQARPYFEIEMLRAHDLVITADTRALPALAAPTRYHGLLADKLAVRLGEPVTLLASDQLLWATIDMGGHSLQVGFGAGREEVRPLYVVLVVVVVAAALFAVGAAYLVRRVARPLSKAAAAVKSFRGARGFEPLPEQGPDELVTLATSFNAMAKDVSELIANRTTLLAGVSHDLRTPLTRMRFALELLPEDVPAQVRERFDRNLTAMEGLVTNALRFARGTREAARVVDFKNSLLEVVAPLGAGIAVCWRGDPGRVALAPGAFQRVVANLVQNAEHHGGGARVVVESSDAEITVHVMDRGPGIPAAARERVFQPFYRLDASRQSATGGIGLGLAVVRQLCQAHGWRIALGAAPTTGVDAVLSIPRAAPASAGAAPPVAHNPSPPGPAGRAIRGSP